MSDENEHAEEEREDPEKEAEPDPTPKKDEGEERIGVYICHCGGNISDKVDVEKVAKEAGELPGVAISRTNMFMCSDPGQELIVKDIEEHHLDHVVVASCSPSLHETTFRTAVSRGGLNPFIYEHANVREQVSWVHPSREEATEKASVLVKAAVGKARGLVPLDPIRVEASERALVVGGGVAGMRAAIDLSRRGVPVTLVEKEPGLGGRVLSLGGIFGGNSPGDSSAEPRGPEVAKALVDEVRADPRITVFTSARIVSASGYVGNFTALVEEAGGEGEEAQRHEVRAGVVLVATGFSPYSPRKGEYGFGRRSRVITLPDFVAMLAGVKDDDGPLLFEGEPVGNVAFIHCVGSREIEGVHKPHEDGRIHTYCSRVCCNSTLKAVNDLHRRWPDIHVFDFYRDIRTYGRGHEDLYEQASRDGTIFIRYPDDGPPKVTKAKPGDGGHLIVTARDGLTYGEEVETVVDLVVLAVGMVPEKIPELVDSLKLPQGTDGFLLEVHPKLRPVEVAVNGVVLAGTSQGPKDITESCESASAAAAKAASILTRGYVDLDPYVARVNPDRCEGSGLCAAECDYEGALRIEETEVDGAVVKRAAVNPALCVGCGCCVAVCPNRAIDVAGWPLDGFEAMVDAIVGAEVA